MVFSKKLTILKTTNHADMSQHGKSKYKESVGQSVTTLKIKIQAIP
jgi:hypothetical protein